MATDLADSELFLHRFVKVSAISVSYSRRNGKAAEIESILSHEVSFA